MAITAVVGVHFGDEGKGKIVDHLASTAQMVIRFNGGANAGHTVVNEQGDFRLHLLPSGIFTPNCTSVMGPGTVIDPAALLDEMAQIAAAGLPLHRFWVSNRAHVVMPYHKQLDALEEEARGGHVQGTTRRGIGPAYVDRVGRAGIRMGDLLDVAGCRDVIEQAAEQKNRVLTRLYGADPLDVDDLVSRALAWGDALRPYIVDTLMLVHRAIAAGHDILLEGQLGVMRDLEWGIYPYVTSSSGGPGSAAMSAGVPSQQITRVVGVAKALASSVGEGPFPTEIHGSQAEQLRRAGPAEGWEFGAATGRPRRIGWFDCAALRYAVMAYGVTEVALTKIDALEGLDKVRLCTGYRVDGQIAENMPLTRDLARVEPVYEELAGWPGPLANARNWSDLPTAARAYIDRIAQLAGVPVTMIGVGPRREQLIVR